MIEILEVISLLHYKLFMNGLIHTSNASRKLKIETEILED